MKLPVFTILEEVSSPVWSHESVINLIGNAWPIWGSFLGVARSILFNNLNHSITNPLTTYDPSLDQLSRMFKTIPPVSILLKKVYHIIPRPNSAGIKVIGDAEEIRGYFLRIPRVHSGSR